MRITKWASILISTGLLWATSAYSLTPESEKQLAEVKIEWAKAKYNEDQKAQVQAFKSLVSKTKALNETHPNEPEFALWHGTTLATYASIKGGLGALRLAKAAKKELEKAIEADPSVGNGFGQAVLGSLYAKVPGKPIGFGSKATADVHLKWALQIAPESMDTNFYMAEYLITQNEYELAREHLILAKNADQHTSDDAYQGRQQEIIALLHEVNSRA